MGLVETEWLTEKRKRAAYLKNRVLTAHGEYVARDNLTYEQSREKCVERFAVDGLTARKFDNMVTKGTGPELDSDVKAKYIIHAERLKSRCEQQIEDLDLELEQIDKLDQAGEEWYDLKRVSGSTSKGYVDTVESVSLSEARQMIYKRIRDAENDYADKLKALLPKDSGNTTVNVGISLDFEKRMSEAYKLRGTRVVGNTDIPTS